MTHLHHLFSAAEWSGVGDEYRPASLAAEGFIHFSTAEQIPATSLRYYAEVADLLVVTIDTDRVDAEVVWEDLHGTGVFPHLYGPLPAQAVVQTQPYAAGEPFSAS